MRKSVLNHWKSKLLIGAAATLAVQTWAQPNPQSPPPAPGISPPSAVKEQPALFIKQAASDNNLAITLADLGATKAQNPDLKAFCSDIQKEHIQANAQLQPLAQKYAVVLEQSPSRRELREASKFEKLTGAEFDQKLATALLEGHQKSIVQCDKAGEAVEAPDVKQYATELGFKLRHHFEHGQEVAKTVGVDQATISAIASKVPAAVGGTGSAQEPKPSVGGEKIDQGAGAKQLQPGAKP
ncbi:MAG TPA: DUF4142 domain-containing protein [Candidatus Binatia bacterium]|jgi:predicted outer membrane protein|nr:DUF4142 domain-containing protein [Candidatus Binatia bacterium]